MSLSPAQQLTAVLQAVDGINPLKAYELDSHNKSHGLERPTVRRMDNHAVSHGLELRPTLQVAEAVVGPNKQPSLVSQPHQPVKQGEWFKKERASSDVLRTLKVIHELC